MPSVSVKGPSAVPSSSATFSVINSVSDIAMMALGFFAARKLPVWASIAAVFVLEIVPLFVIRDNLTLNVWMLLWPSDALRSWQAG